jgi:hypothetical protein
MVGGLTMGANDGNIVGHRDWVKEFIETRVERGKEWRCRLEDHKELAKASRYVRILGRTFRPVSISDINPCGHLRYKDSNDEIKSCPRLNDAIKRAGSATEQKPGANKPEHQVQAFLIRAALQNVSQFGRFHGVLPDFSNVFDELIFITDELSMNNGKVRADIVALGGSGGQFFPVFIELKNHRRLSELKRQLNDADKWLWKEAQARDPFSRFLSAVSGVPLENIRQDEEAARKMIIWPKSRSGNELITVNEARDKGGFLIVAFEPTTYLFSSKNR